MSWDPFISYFRNIVNMIHTSAGGQVYENLAYKNEFFIQINDGAQSSISCIFSGIWSLQNNKYIFVVCCLSKDMDRGSKNAYHNDPIGEDGISPPNGER